LQNAKNKDIQYYFFIECIYSSAKLQSPSLAVIFFCSCGKVYPKQEVRFLLYLLGQFVTWQSDVYTLDWKWPRSWLIVGELSIQLHEVQCIAIDFQLETITKIGKWVRNIYLKITTRFNDTTRKFQGNMFIFSAPVFLCWLIENRATYINTAFLHVELNSSVFRMQKKINSWNFLGNIGKIYH